MTDQHFPAPGQVLGFAPRPLETGLADTVAHEMRLLGMRQA